jgi:hypothetical protein
VVWFDLQAASPRSLGWSAVWKIAEALLLGLPWS